MIEFIKAFLITRTRDFKRVDLSSCAVRFPMEMNRFIISIALSFMLSLGIWGQNASSGTVESPDPELPGDAWPQTDEAEAVLKKAFSVIKDGVNVSFQSFTDVIVFPDKERTEFKGGGVKQVQTNVGNTGWLFDGDMEQVKDQTGAQVANFQRGIRVSLDHLLRGYWRNEAKLSYVGKRPASLGKRNDVVKLTYNDGLVVEFEFAADTGIPAKTINKRTNADGEEIVEEDRYAQFIETNGITAPYIVDRFTNGKPTSRINYESIEYDKHVPDSIFAKPSNPKDLKKDMKL